MGPKEVTLFCRIPAEAIQYRMMDRIR